MNPFAVKKIFDKTVPDYRFNENIPDELGRLQVSDLYIIPSVRTIFDCFERLTYTEISDISLTGYSVIQPRDTVELKQHLERYGFSYR